MQGPSSSSNGNSNQQQTWYSSQTQQPTAQPQSSSNYTPNDAADPWTYGPNGTGAFNGPNWNNGLPDPNDTSRLGGTTTNWNAPSTIGGFSNPSPQQAYGQYWAPGEGQILPSYGTPESLLNASYALPNAQDPANWPIFQQQIARLEGFRGQNVGDPFVNELKIRQMQAALAGSGYTPPGTTTQTPSTPTTPTTTQGDQVGDPARWNQLVALPAYQNLDPSIQTSLRSLLGM